MKHKKLFFIFLAFIFILLVLIPKSSVLAQAEEEEGSPLEIVYPIIPGEAPPPTVVSEGLPSYIKYVFNFAMVVIGIIILGVLIYNGIQYITSSGNPEKLSSAKQGIISGFLGAVILFSAVFIFNTINPQLTILELPDPDIIEPVITPGIYICNYNVDNVNGLIQSYKEAGDLEKRIEAAKNIKKIMRDNGNICFRVAFSGNISFSFYLQNNTMFAIPKKTYVDNNIEWVYEYGIILHQKDNFRGKCAVFIPYDEYLGVISADPPAGARSITVFEEPLEVPGSGQQGVTLYQCLDYNQAGSCPSGLKGGTPADATFPTVTPSPNVTRVKNLGKLPPIANNLASPTGKENVNGVRSIKIDREGYYLAVLFSENFYSGDICEVVSASDNNLLDQPIGQCEISWDGRSCKGLFDWNEEEEYLRDCKPCTNSLMVIKGNVVR